MISFDSKYKIIKKLKQKDHNKQTFKAIRISDNTPVIIKKFNCKNEYANISFQREKNINIVHKNINKLIDYFNDNTNGYIVREFIEGINLQKAFEKYKVKQKLKNKLIKKITLETLYGLETLHNNDIIHRDIRPENIMLQFTSNISEAKAVICDFEMAKLSSLVQIDKFNNFSFYFSPPEQVLHLNNLINSSSDIYALGITLWVLFTNKVPFKHHIPEVIANLQVTYPLQYDKKIPPQFWKIIKKATFKHKFRKPPFKYSKEKIIELIQNAQEQRYQNAQEMIEDIKKIKI